MLCIKKKIFLILLTFIPLLLCLNSCNIKQKTDIEKIINLYKDNTLTDIQDIQQYEKIWKKNPSFNLEYTIFSFLNSNDGKIVFKDNERMYSWLELYEKKIISIILNTNYFRIDNDSYCIGASLSLTFNKIIPNAKISLDNDLHISITKHSILEYLFIYNDINCSFSLSNENILENFTNSSSSYSTIQSYYYEYKDDGTFYINPLIIQQLTEFSFTNYDGIQNSLHKKIGSL